MSFKMKRSIIEDLGSDFEVQIKAELDNTDGSYGEVRKVHSQCVVLRSEKIPVASSARMTESGFKVKPGKSKSFDLSGWDLDIHYGSISKRDDLSVEYAVEAYTKYTVSLEGSLPEAGGRSILQGEIDIAGSTHEVQVAVHTSQPDEDDESFTISGISRVESVNPDDPILMEMKMAVVDDSGERLEEDDECKKLHPTCSPVLSSSIYVFDSDELDVHDASDYRMKCVVSIYKRCFSVSGQHPIQFIEE